MLLAFVGHVRAWASAPTSCASAASPSPSARWSTPRSSWSRTCTSTSSATGPARRTGGRSPIEASKEVGPALFFSLLIIAVSFLPVFTLEAQEGRLFKPLAFTKTFAMLGAALPQRHPGAGPDGLPHARAASVRSARTRSTARSSRVYRPVARGACSRHPARRSASLAWCCVGDAVADLRASAASSCRRSYEGDLLYMPTTLPGISISEARQVLAADRPHPQELPRGRPRLRQGGPRRDGDRSGAAQHDRDRSSRSSPKSEWPRGMTRGEAGRTEMDAAVQLPRRRPTPGRCPSRRASTCSPPASRRRSASRSSGPTSPSIAKHRRAASSRACKRLPGTRRVYAERVTGGNFLDINIRPRAGGALRHQRRRRPGRDRHRRSAA